MEAARYVVVPLGAPFASIEGVLCSNTQRSGVGSELPLAAEGVEFDGAKYGWARRYIRHCTKNEQTTNQGIKKLIDWKIVHKTGPPLCSVLCISVACVMAIPTTREISARV